MNQNIEIEFKNLLTESEYTNLFKELKLNTQSTFTQENIYFDTPDFSLKGKKLALRIRIKENQAEITLKSPHKGHLLETNMPLTISETNAILQKNTFVPTGMIAEVLESYEINLTRSLHIFARLKTERIEKKVQDSIIVLDKSWYADQVDYELEVESLSAEEGTQLINDLLEKYSIPRRKTPNKIARAFKALGIDGQ